MTTMKAKFDGKCSVCGCRIALGQLQVYDRANKKVYCMAHNPEKQQAQKSAASTPVAKPSVTSAKTEPVAKPAATGPAPINQQAVVMAACDALIAAAQALKLALGAKG